MTRQKMIREELTREIVKRVNDIKNLYYTTYPEGDYLSLFFKKDCTSFNNENWEGGKDENYPIDYWERDEQ